MISIETLRRYKLFAGQDYEMLKQIAMLGSEEIAEAGDWLFHQGAPARNLYLVLDGTVVMTQHRYEEEEPLLRMSTLGEGEVLACTAVIKPHVYRLCAQAVQKTRLAVFDAAALRALLDENPEAGYHFLTNLAQVIGDRLCSFCTQLISPAMEANP